MGTDIKLSPDELRDLTDCARAPDQLEVLHKRGFFRAYIGRTGRVVLERAHYEAVCAGATLEPGRTPRLRTPNRRAGVRREEEPGTAAAGVPARAVVSLDGRRR